MKKFPQIAEHQVALVWADVKTGQVLDDNFAVVTQEAQNPYKIFDNVKAALEYAKQNITPKGNLECVIHGADEELLHYITPDNIKNF